MPPDGCTIQYHTGIIQPDRAFGHGWATAQAISPHNAAHGMAMQIRRCHHARAAHVWRRGGAGAFRPVRCIGIHRPEVGREAERGGESDIGRPECYNITFVYISVRPAVKIKGGSARIPYQSGL
ncbi:hypothetical protein JCM25156A_12700 [Komagataeibacter kakiaceti JCM 25156]